MDDWRKRIACKYHANGTCRFGDSCNYSHDMATGGQSQRRTPILCRNFKSGHCPYGTKCRFLHPEISKEEARERRINALLNPSKQGYCPDNPCQDRHCNHLHGFECQHCNRLCLDPQDMDKQLQHLEQCFQKSKENPTSRVKICGICLEDVAKTERRTFGILTNCLHPFCFTCIQEWRRRHEYDMNVKHGCPECRVMSEWVVPSKIWVDTEEKEEFVARHKKRLAAIHCKNFNRGHGYCTFMAGCLYKHETEDGRPPNYGLARQELALLLEHMDIPYHHHGLSLEELIASQMYLTDNESDLSQDSEEEEEDEDEDESNINMFQLVAMHLSSLNDSD